VAKPEQINVSFDLKTYGEIERLAHARGISRPEFMRCLAVAAIEADHDGRELFEQPQTPAPPAIEPRLLVELTGRMDQLTGKLSNVLRARDRRDAELMEQAGASAEAVHAAKQQLADQMNERLRAGIAPFRQEIEALSSAMHQADAQREVALTAHRDEITSALTDHPGFASVAAELARLEIAVRTARPSVVVRLGDNWHAERWELAVYGAFAFLGSTLLLVLLAHLLPDALVATPVSRALFGGNLHAACVLSGNTYDDDGSCRAAGIRRER